MARYKAHLKFWPSLTMALILALFLQLSSWQWHRYHQKRALQTTYLLAQSAPETALEHALIDHPSDPALFLAVRATGHYDSDHQIVFDNRAQQGQPGYEILTPLLINATTAILIDRGFIPVGRNWQSLPDLTLSTPLVTLNGFLTQPSHNFILGPAIEPTTQAWPLRAARIDIQALQSHYPYTLLPYVLLLKPAQTGSYLCHWSYPQLFAERSLGYTFQWLALAIATIGLWLIISFKKR